MERSLWIASASGGGPRTAPGLARVLIPLCLALYFLVGYARIRTTDWVPFSAWALFVFVPNQPSVYAVKLVSLGDRVFNPRLEFQAADGVIANPHDIVAVYLINKMGYALEKGDANGASGYRALLEANALPRGLRWELVRVTYDPLERWKTGLKTETPVAEFVSGGRLD